MAVPGNPWPTSEKSGGARLPPLSDAAGGEGQYQAAGRDHISAMSVLALLSAGYLVIFPNIYEVFHVQWSGNLSYALWAPALIGVVVALVGLLRKEYSGKAFVRISFLYAGTWGMLLIGRLRWMENVDLAVGALFIPGLAGVALTLAGYMDKEYSGGRAARIAALYCVTWLMGASVVLTDIRDNTYLFFEYTVPIIPCFVAIALAVADRLRGGRNGTAIVVAGSMAAVVVVQVIIAYFLHVS
ncbi:hypothetical protein AB0K60_10565 [Thermopolyspora sp. NPDC052614]|uniref:hypothetical protein n=1 Tax=Thermopolyspora sp. NPDC052614 TaxID=3155682 RepID=UPI003439F24D